MGEQSDRELDYMEWRRAVRARRGRMQARWLVGLVGTALGISLAGTILGGLSFIEGRTLGEVAAISVVFALAAWGLKAATPWAAVFGGVICFLVTLTTGRSDESVMRSGLTPLLLLFVLTFGAGRMGRKRKAVVEEDFEEERHGRKAAQVIANLGMAALCVGVGSEWLGALGDGSQGRTWAVAPVLMLAALAEATADTVSSEIGQAFGGTPRMLTTLRRVAAGTDGAVSVGGTAAGVAAAGIVVGVGGWAVHLGGVVHLGGTEMGFALGAGVAGLVFDSLLGATVERRGWLGNDLVNFSSTVFAVAVALGLMRLFGGRG